MAGSLRPRAIQNLRATAEINFCLEHPEREAFSETASRNDKNQSKQLVLELFSDWQSYPARTRKERIVSDLEDQQKSYALGDALSELNE